MFYLREVVGDKMVDLLEVGFKAATRSGRTFLLSVTQNIIKMIIFKMCIIKMIIVKTSSKSPSSRYQGTLLLNITIT